MEEYKERIRSFLEKDSVENKENIIRLFLKNDYNNNKLTKEEYNELVNFLKEKIEEIKNEEKRIKQEEFNKELNEFQKSIRLDVTPIYKGKMGVVAPGIQKTSKDSDNTENQREEK